MSVTLPVSQATEEKYREYHWTVDAFYRAAEAGAFDDPSRLELIQGRIIEKMPISPLHTALTNIIADALRAVLSSRLTIRAESAIHIAFDGEPIPDVSAVTGGNCNYLTRHPTPEAVALLVEIAITSVEYDLGAKALLYAQAGIEDYWVALPEAGEVVVHREPTAGGYQSVTKLSMDEIISPLAASDVFLPVRELLDPAVGEASFGVN